MIQDPSTGSALSIAHTGANGAGAPSLAAGAKENSADWVVDAASQYGSLGVQKVSAGAANPVPILGFVYPAQEGDVTYIGGTQQKWVRRSSPVSAGASQSYTLAINLDRYSATSATQDVADFPTALQQTWRRYYGTFAPPISPDRSSVAFTDGIHLLNSTYQAQAATSSVGFPFNIPDVVAGTPGNYSFQMGYVGEQIPLAFQLLRYGTMSGDALSLAQGKAILDFWATQDPPAQSSGLPLPWFAPAAPVYKWVNQNCSSPIYLRMVGDGMEGMVAAAIYARQQPSIGPKPAWEKFASGFADWLATNQAADGSFARAYNPDGSVWLPRSGCEANVTVDGASKLNTTFPIRFLVSMYFATGNGAYAAAAQKAGAYALANIYGPTAYTGGITSRNALDREAGAQAVHAALALYDLAYAQGDAAAQSRWLAAARQAADYLETWQYAWNFPILDPTGTNPQYVFAGTKATSLDGTGVSTGGSYLGIASFDYYRLHLLTQEDPQTGHYGQFALMLASNATLTTQLSGIASQQFGWRYNGLLTEATNLSGFSLGTAGIGWLPWLTNSQLDPLQRLTDVFGSASVATILANEADASTLSRYGVRNHMLYPSAGSLGWSR